MSIPIARAIIEAYRFAFTAAAVWGAIIAMALISPERMP